MTWSRRPETGIASRCALAVAGVLSCAIAAPWAEAQTANAAADARTFVADAERRLDAADQFEARAGWVQATNITPDTDWLLQRAASQRAALSTQLASMASRFDRTALDTNTSRKLGLLTRLDDMPAPDLPGAADTLSAIANRLSSAYATGTFTHWARNYTLRDAEAALATSRDPAETRAIWEGWRTVAGPMRADYARMVELGNAGARERGYADVGAMWRSAYDMPAQAFADDVERLWRQLSPLYASLHAYVRSRLNARYGDAVQPHSGPIRADLVGNMWGQDWSNIYDIVGVQAHGSEQGLTSALRRSGYDARKMVRSAEEFYVSLGFDPLPATFWERSQFTRPPGREVDCNASAWSIDGAGDVRIKTCFEVGEPDWIRAHHELGHNYYSLATRHQPFLFRGAANPGMSEGFGDFIALSTNTAADLRSLGLQDAGGNDDIAALLNVALGKLPLLGYAVSVDEWRWGVFSGAIAPADYNRAWWKLAEKNQGLTPPGARPDDANDALAKYHLPNNVPYISYFMAYVYQFQLYRAACRMAGWKGPLHRCTIRGNTAVGARLGAMLAKGRSQPAAVTIAQFTGEPKADAGAMLEYFAPLTAWLNRQNRGR